MDNTIYRDMFWVLVGFLDAEDEKVKSEVKALLLESFGFKI